MDKEINLLSQKTKFSKEKKLLRILKILSYGLLIFVFMSSVIVFFINQFSQNTSLQMEKNSLVSSLANFDKRIGKSLFIESRLNDASQILQKRVRNDEILASILKEVPNAVSIQSLTIDQKTFAFTVSSPSLTTLNQFTNNLVSESAQNKSFKKVTLDSLTLDERNNQYVVSVVIDLST